MKREAVTADDRYHLVHEGVGRDYHRLGSQMCRLPRFLTCQVGDFFSSDALELKPNPRRSGCRGVVIVDMRGRDGAKTRCIVVVSEPFWVSAPFWSAPFWCQSPFWSEPFWCQRPFWSARFWCQSPSGISGLLVTIMCFGPGILRYKRTLAMFDRHLIMT
jgi:hypothetical protein